VRTRRASRSLQRVRRGRPTHRGLDLLRTSRHAPQQSSMCYSTPAKMRRLPVRSSNGIEPRQMPKRARDRSDTRRDSSPYAIAKAAPTDSLQRRSRVGRRTPSRSIAAHTSGRQDSGILKYFCASMTGIRQARDLPSRRCRSLMGDLVPTPVLRSPSHDVESIPMTGPRHPAGRCQSGTESYPSGSSGAPFHQVTGRLAQGSDTG
jgi:hypothetical protein